MSESKNELALAAFRLIAVQGASRTPQAHVIWQAVMGLELEPVFPSAVNWTRDGREYRAHDPALLVGITTTAAA
jgi:hypothetical protein